MAHKIPLTHTPESLIALADAFVEQAELLRAVGVGIKASGLKDLAVPNNDQRKRGMQYIESFTNAARTALREAKEDRGDFGPPVPKVGEGSKPRGRPRKTAK